MAVPLAKAPKKHLKRTLGNAGSPVQLETGAGTPCSSVLLQNLEGQGKVVWGVDNTVRAALVDRNGNALAGDDSIPIQCVNTNQIWMDGISNGLIVTAVVFE